MHQVVIFSSFGLSSLLLYLCSVLLSTLKVLLFLFLIIIMKCKYYILVESLIQLIFSKIDLIKIYVSIPLIKINPTINLSFHTKCQHQHPLEHFTSTLSYHTKYPHHHPLTHIIISLLKLFTLANHIIY